MLEENASRATSPSPRTKLLVSVRSAAEAAAAFAGGADLIDVKEPRHGSLGRAETTVVADIAREVAGRAPVSMALGELLENNPLDFPLGAEICLAKLGLAGCRPQPDWRQRWRRAVAALPSTCQAVAVVYADWDKADAPPPEDVLCEAKRLGCPFLLIDTFDKSRGGLLDHWPPESLRRFAQEVESAGLRLVLAGSLQSKDLPQVLTIQPSYVAVRSAVCPGLREGDISEQLVRQLTEQIHAASHRDSKHGADTSAVSSVS